PEPGCQDSLGQENGGHPNGNDGTQAHSQPGQPNPSTPATGQPYALHTRGTNATTGNSEPARPASTGMRGQPPPQQSQQGTREIQTLDEEEETLHTANNQT